MLSLSRADFIKKRLELDEDTVQRQSRRIGQKLTALALFQKAKRVFAYIPTKGEVDTRPMIETAWQQGKEVAVPKVIGKRIMVFLKIASFSELTKGQFGILEPSASAQVLPCTEDTVFLVPGVAFDQGGTRLGYGGGFYDAYLSGLQLKPLAIIGLCYDCQLVKKLERNAWDVPMDFVLTP